MKKNQNIDTEKMFYNPFVSNLIIEATQLVDYNKFIADEDGVMLPATSLIEKKEYTKIFYSAGAKDMVYNLSAGAKSLYLFILYNLETNVQYIQINVERYMKKNSIKSINTYKEAVKELCRYLFLIQSSDYKDVYWTNPELFFNGNRIKTFSNKVVIKGKLNI